MRSKASPSPRRFRRLRKIVAIVAIAAAALLLFLQYGLGPAVKHGAQTVGSALLGCDIAITNCHMRLLSGVVDMEGVVVGPPEGFDANLFEMERLRVDFSPRTVFGSEPLLIREIAITNVLVSYELKGLDSNISAVMKKLGSDEKESEEEKEDETSDEGGKKVVIEHFVFAGAKVRAAFWDGKGIKPSLPTIELTDIGKKSGGVTSLEAVGDIFGSIGKGVIGLVADLGGAVADAAAAVGGAAADAAVSVGGAAADAAAAVGGAVSDGAKAVGDAIGTLFGGSGD